MAKMMKKLPKRVAGVKIPKVVRKGPLVDFLNSTAGQMLLGEVLTLAAGAFAMKQVDSNSPVGDFLHHPVDGLKRASSARSAATTRLGHALSEAVHAFRTALAEPQRDGNTATTDAANASIEEARPQKKGPAARDQVTSPH